MSTFTRCPYCHEIVEPTDPDSTYAVKQHDLPGMGQAHDFVDGMGAYFHAECPPEAVSYAPRQRPP
jgi:hypothetical protein